MNDRESLLLVSLPPGLLWAALGWLWGFEQRGIRTFYGFTELRGKAVGRGRDGHGSLNQVTAGLMKAFSLQIVCALGTGLGHRPEAAA